MTKLAKIVMSVSLALNVLFLGFFLGHALPIMTPEKYVLERNRELLSILPPETAIALQPRLAAVEVRMAETMSELKSIKNQLSDAMSDPAFDEQAVRQILDKVTVLREANFESLSQLLIAAAKDLKLEDRRKIADHLRNAPVP